VKFLWNHHLNEHEMVMMLVLDLYKNIAFS